MKINKLVIFAGLSVTAAAAVGSIIAFSTAKLPSAFQKDTPLSVSRQEDIVKAQKLKNDLEAACKARNMQACEQIGITKEDVAWSDEFDRISSKLEDDIARINLERDTQKNAIKSGTNESINQEQPPSSEVSKVETFNARIYDPPSNCRAGASKSSAVKQVLQKGDVLVDRSNPQKDEENKLWYREQYLDCWIHESQVQFK